MSESWRGPDGEVLDEGVVRTYAGDAHCDLDDVVFLEVPAEAVDVPHPGDKRVAYVRDPNNDAVPDRHVALDFETVAALWRRAWTRSGIQKITGVATTDARQSSAGGCSLRLEWSVSSTAWRSLQRVSLASR